MEITTNTGAEDHSSYGAKGYIFIVAGGEETHIYQAPQARLLEQEWEKVDQRGVHGRWCAARYDVPAGTILKLFAIGTWRGSYNKGDGGAVFFVVDPAAPPVEATGGTYAGRGGRLAGPLRQLSLAEVAALGITIEPKMKHFYKPGLITVQAVALAAVS